MKTDETLIYLPHPVSKKHPQMSRKRRSAQFAAFAALSGYKEKLDELVKANENQWCQEEKYQEDWCEDWRWD